jgi:hypothetical protein
MRETKVSIPWRWSALKSFKSRISEIASNKLNTWHNKFAAQFTQLQKNVANYLQRMTDEGYLVAQMVRTGEEQIIKLPEQVDMNSQATTNDAIIRSKMVKTVAKRRMKLTNLLMKMYTTMYGQCSQEVKDKLKASADWERIQRNQLLHKLINKIDQIYVGFDDHKQEVFNLVQSVRMLFLVYTLGKKDSVEEYGRNFCSLRDTVEAFGGSPGVHKGMVDAMLLDTKEWRSPTTPPRRK